MRSLDREVVIASSERLCVRLRRPRGGRWPVEFVCCCGGEEEAVEADDDDDAHGEPFYCVALPYTGHRRLASERAREQAVDVALVTSGGGVGGGTSDDAVAVRIRSRDSAQLRAARRARGAFPVEGVERVRRYLTRGFRDSAVVLAAMGHTRLMSPAASHALQALYGEVGGADWLRQFREGVAGALVDACAQLRRVARGASGGDCCGAMRFHLASAWQALEGFTAVQVFLLSELDRLMVAHCRQVTGRQPEEGYDEPDECHAKRPDGVATTQGEDDEANAEEPDDGSTPASAGAAFQLAAWTALLRLIELSHSPASHHRRVLRSRAFLALARLLLLDLEGLAGAVEALAEAAP